MSKSLLRLAILSAPLLLTACGEGWEVQRVSNYGTYEGDRTAGTGVVYVRAKMLPKKEFVVEPVMEEIKPEIEEVKAEEVKPMEEPAPVLEAEEIFTEAQQKGVAPESAVEKDAKADVLETEDETASLEEIDSDALTPMPDVEEKGEVFEEEDHSSLMNDDREAEEYIAQAPKTIIAPKVEVIKMSSYEQNNGVRLLKTAAVDRSDIESVEVYENEVVQPQKHIIVPKKDMGSYLSVGEEELHEIYSQPF